jgi:2-polyprenyl-3-methyl-5-hydroxy-6-metoxy-1,4-benzoquinol methylase
MSSDPSARPPKETPYAHRLEGLERRWIARTFDVQRPYRRNIRRLDPGFVLDVGCGLGRNLSHLDARGVGVEPDEVAVATARARGLTVFTPAEFAASTYAGPARFDSLLVAHVLEHLTPEDGEQLLRRYLPSVRDGGRVIMICPQEAGFRSDATHVTFLDGPALVRLAESCGIAEIEVRSFPFARVAGRLFRYNETVVVGRVSG